MSQDAPLRKCTTCRSEKPEDTEHFATDSRSKKLNATCRECNNARNKKRPGRRKLEDGLSGAVMETTRVVKDAFRDRDPDGTEANLLRRQLNGVLVRFKGMSLAEKARHLAWFAQSFVGAQIAPVGRQRGKEEKSNAAKRNRTQR